MAHTRNKRRNATAGTSKDTSPSKRARRSRETTSATHQSSLNAEGAEGSPKHVTRRQRQDSGQSVQGEDISKEEDTSKPVGEVSQKPLSTCSVQPMDAKLTSVSEGDKHGTDSVASPGSSQQSPRALQSFVGTLLSSSLQYPHLCLAGRVLLFGRGASCHVHFRDPCVPEELCQLEAGTGSCGERSVALKCLAPERLFVNNSALQKDQQVSLKGGEEITIMGSVAYSFIFQPNGELTSGRASEERADCGPEKVPTVERAVPEGSAAQPERNTVEQTELQAPMATEEAQPLEEGVDAGSNADPGKASSQSDGRRVARIQNDTGLIHVTKPLPHRVVLAGPGVDQIHISPSHSPTASGRPVIDPGNEMLPSQLRQQLLQLFNTLSVDTRSHKPGALPLSLTFPIPEASDGPNSILKPDVPSDKGANDEGSSPDKVTSKQEGPPGEADAADPGTPVREADDAVERHAKQVETFCEEISKMIRNAEDIDINWETFPHYLGKGTKQRLMSAAFVHLKRADFSKYTMGLSSMSNRILLSGPYGSDIYQETIVRALAKELNSQLLVYDHAQLLSDIASDEETDDKALPPLLDAAGTDDEDGDLWGADDERGDKGELSQAWRSGPSSSSRPWAGPLSVIGRKRVRYSSDNVLAGATGQRAAQGRTAKGGNSSGHVFKVGDRVKYLGSSRDSGASASGQAAPILGLPGPIQGIFCNLHTSSSRRDNPAPTAGTSKDPKGPWPGLRGRVVVTAEDNPKKVGVRFDHPIPGGGNLNKKCEDQHGYYCQPAELRLENVVDKSEEANAAAIDALFEVITKSVKDGPLVLFIKDLEKHLLEDMNRYMQFARRMETVAGGVLIVGSHTGDARRERGNGGGLFGRLGSHPLLDLGFIDGIPQIEDRNRNESSKAVKLLSRVLPNRITLHAPQDEPAAADWKKMLEQDVATMREIANRNLIKNIMNRCDIECSEVDGVVIRDQSLNNESAEKIVGWALAHHLMSADAQPLPPNGRLTVKSDSLTVAVEMLRTTQAEAQPSKNLLKDVQPDNEFEKRLLSEVIPAEEVGVGFDDIGALDNVKQTLREVVMLPLQRPELFSRGSLTKPTKGVLLFGPPGTGKTMLAKAVASESGANFINASMSSLASKWFGEGEKYVRALFSLAHKIAPSVIFIDEVDSMLGRRDKTGEHEAMRKIKNEFMANWDGLRTCERDRVLVLAATNRPMDLDEAVIRRMPRRLFVDLPDQPNRIKILKIILKHEDLEKGFEYDELARLTDGYSGSDLHNLCVAAAYRPIRDYLDTEKGKKDIAVKKAAVIGAETQPAEGEVQQSQRRQAVSSSGQTAEDTGATATGMAVDAAPSSSAAELQAAPSGKAIAGTSQELGEAQEEKPVRLRALTMADFKAAMEQVGASVSQDAVHMNELRQWNEMYGEGGSRRKSPLPYFM